MIHATKADVDEAHAKLVNELQDLDRALLVWKNNPTSQQAHRRAQACFETAELAFADHTTTLAAWATGPIGDDRD